MQIPDNNETGEYQVEQVCKPFTRHLNGKSEILIGNIAVMFVADRVVGHLWIDFNHYCQNVLQKNVQWNK